jgi:hypothetical protein
MQGESDRQWADSYAVNLSAFVAAFRRDLRSPRLPFVIGRVSPDGTLEREKIRLSQASHCRADACALWIDLDNLGRFDGVHYDSQGTVLLGELFAESYIRLLMLSSARLRMQDQWLSAEYVRPRGARLEVEAYLDGRWQGAETYENALPENGLERAYVRAHGRERDGIFRLRAR